MLRVRRTTAAALLALAMIMVASGCANDPEGVTTTDAGAGDATASPMEVPIDDTWDEWLAERIAIGSPRDESDVRSVLGAEIVPLQLDVEPTLRLVYDRPPAGTLDYWADAQVGAVAAFVTDLSYGQDAYDRPSNEQLRSQMNAAAEEQRQQASQPNVTTTVESVRTTDLPNSGAPALVTRSKTGGLDLLTQVGRFEFSVITKDGAAHEAELLKQFDQWIAANNDVRNS